MSAVLGSHAASNDFGARLAFQKQLQVVTNKIHATSNIDEIMLEMSAEVCALFHADRLTTYSRAEDKQSIVSKVKTGLNSFKDLKLPIAEHSIAGYAAFAKKTLNIWDVYDDGEWGDLDLNTRIADQSIAGYVAFANKTLNIRDVYDDGELRALNPNLRFLQEVDKRTGYRTKQMLVSAIIEAGGAER